MLGLEGLIRRYGDIIWVSRFRISSMIVIFIVQTSDNPTTRK